MAEILKLHASNALDMFLKQREQIKTVTGRVTFCPPALSYCRILPVTTSQTANRILGYWAKEIARADLSFFDMLSLRTKLPAQRSPGTLTAKDTYEFWEALKGVASDLSVLKAVPTIWEMTIDEIKKDLIDFGNRISNALPRFAVPSWVWYASGAVAVLWLLKVKR